MALSEEGSPWAWVHRRTCLSLLISVLAIVTVGTHPASAQQQYNNVSGYACTGVETHCQAYAWYRTQAANATVNSTAVLFNTSTAAVLNANTFFETIPVTAALSNGTSMYIPLDCGCLNNSYEAPTSKVVQSGDTMFDIANSLFQGLTTYQAIMASNPSVRFDAMAVNTTLKIPIRCACPSAAQQTAGFKSLLTYSIFPEETLSFIATKFNLTEADLLSANLLPNNTVQAYTTVLVPLRTSNLNNSSPVPASSPTGNAASRTFQAHWLCSISLLAVQSLLFYHSK